MTALLYYLIIKPISFIPLSISYIFSDLLFLIIYRLGGYRTKLVRSNLERSFPEKSSEEIEKITQEFYHHFCDLLVESLHFFSMSEAELKRRFVVKNPELLDKFYDNNQSLILMGGHFNNWEIVALAADLNLKHQAVGVYKRLSNKFFEQKMKENRSRFGLELVTNRELIKVFKRVNEQNVGVIMVADQSPTNHKSMYWTNFLNQDTAMIVGTERFAKMYNFPVIYTELHKVKRGYYEAVHQVLEEKPAELQDGELTEKYARKLEAEILKNPPFWLWTHRRWKQKRNDAPLHKIQKIR